MTQQLISKTKQELIEHLLDNHVNYLCLARTAQRALNQKTEQFLTEYHKKFHEEDSS